MVVARALRFGAQRLELRLEAFNVFNTLNLNNPETGLNRPTFGQILGASDPRIMQFGVKYTF
jgi:hypothetical protein